MGGSQSAELPPLSELDALCLDCDGTIYYAGTPIEGVQEALQALRKQVRRARTLLTKSDGVPTEPFSAAAPVKRLLLKAHTTPPGARESGCSS